MLYRSSIRALALAAALGIAIVDAQAFDDRTYPDWSGSWRGIGGGSFDTSKPKGLGQQTPLKPEFQAILEASLAISPPAARATTPDIAAGRTACPGS